MTKYAFLDFDSIIDNSRTVLMNGFTTDVLQAVNHL